MLLKKAAAFVFILAGTLVVISHFSNKNGSNIA